MEGEKKPVGFALLSKEQRAELARLGGKTAHAMKKGHTFTTEEARAAAKKKAAMYYDPERMRELGRKGAIATNARRKLKAARLIIIRELMAKRRGQKGT